ncbi:peroxiredoxin type-2 [Coemansia spiralis]|nr:peroxiredoxin type-2 [Coemansia spiralis]
MAIEVGDTFPAAILSYIPYNAANPDACGLTQQLNTHEAFKGKKVVLFAVPGAFTPTCSESHMPGYIEHLGELKSKGVDIVACVATNDPFVMHGWGKANNVKDGILMLSDVNGELGAALNLFKAPQNPASTGPRRLARFAAIIDDLKVVYLGVETEHGVSVSGAPVVLAKL